MEFDDTRCPGRGLAAADDEWTEVFCTHNEEPEEWKHLDKAVKEGYEDKYKK